MISLLLIEAPRSGIRDPSLRNVVTEYFTHESDTVCLTHTRARNNRYRIAICDAKFAVCDVTLILCRKFCDAIFASKSAIIIGAN